MLNISLFQLNYTVGDLEGNTKLTLDAYKKACKDGADLAAFSELNITGYPAGDLLLNKKFQEEAVKIFERICKETVGKKCALLIGNITIQRNRLLNEIFLIENGRIIGKATKNKLPNYKLFDEKRVFLAGRPFLPVEFKGVKLGLIVCRDMWLNKIPSHLADHGAEVFLALNGSPFHTGKYNTRIEAARKLTKKHGIPVIYINQVGTQDDIVFDGGSFVMNKNGKIINQLALWKEDEGRIQLSHKLIKSSDKIKSPDLGKESLMYNAAVLALHDYTHKNGFSGVIIGLSGGVDSALTAAIAVDALGAKNVRLVMLPSKYTSKESLDDANKCAELLGCELETISIEGTVEAIGKALHPSFKGMKEDLTEENIQSRARGLILMALSNKFHKMLLSTGNKSESAVGYSTLYGDTCGGYNVLKDIYKTDVFKLAKWRNNNLPINAKGNSGTVIPTSIIKKPPTAELRNNQKDSDSLPEYNILDKILFQLIEKEATIDEIVKLGFDKKIVRKVNDLLHKAEHKRRQTPPGPIMSEMSLGVDRRFPITNKFVE